jgi:hypothetical protein
VRGVLSIAAVAVAALVSAGPAGTAPGGRPVAGACSAATARQIATDFFVWGNDVRDPVAQVLCGPFTGAGSNAMAVAFSAPTCWSPQGWAVYTFASGAWSLVMAQRGVFVAGPLVAVGSAIRETQPVFRSGDARCLPSGGTHARLWSWNGSKLVAGPWKQMKKGAPRPGKVATGSFKTPSGNIVCEYFLNFVGLPGSRPINFVRCGIHSGLKPPPRRRACGTDLSFADNRFSLRSTGRATADACVGDAGPFAVEAKARVLGYGKAWSGGGLACKSALSGLTCRNKSGRGFFVSRARWRTF